MNKHERTDAAVAAPGKAAVQVAVPAAGPTRVLAGRLSPAARQRVRRRADGVPAPLRALQQVTA